ncbi:eukaryotic ribosomal protein eS8 family, partial [Rhizoctonia solani]
MPPDLACAVHARGMVGNDLRQALNKCGAIRQIHYFINERGEREAFITFKFKSDAVYAKTKHSFGDVQIFGIVDDFWKNRYIESQNADPEKSGFQQINDYDTFMPHPIVRATPAPVVSTGDDHISDPAGFAVHVEGEVHGTPADNKFARFGPVRQILRFGATSGRPHGKCFMTRLGAAAARNQGHIDQLPIDALSRSEWMMKKYRELIQQDHPFNNGSGPSDQFSDVPRSPRSPRRTQPVVYERNSWTRESDTGRAPRGPPPYNPPPPPRTRAPDTSPRLRHEPPRHEPRPYPDDGRALAGRPLYRDEPRMPVDRPSSQSYPPSGNPSRESIGWKDSRDYPPPSGYERERMTPPGYTTSDPRYDPPLPPSRSREYDDRATRPPPRESSRYSPYPPPRSAAGPYPSPRERVPLSPGPGYPPPPPMQVDDVPRRERALSNDSRRIGSSRSMEAPHPPKTLSPTATSEEALNTLKFMRDMQCQPGQYLIAAEKEPRFADAEALALEGIKGSNTFSLFWIIACSSLWTSMAISTSRPSEAAPLYLFLARLQGERFKTERNPALVLRLARDVVLNLDEASALSRQPLESAMQSLRQEMWAYTRSRASDADVEMLDIPRSGEDPNAQIQRLMDKLRRARDDMRRMEDDLDHERRERRRLQGQLADAQESLSRTSRAAKNDVEDLKKANERHVERIVELERQLEKRNSSAAPTVNGGDTSMADGGHQQIDSKEAISAQATGLPLERIQFVFGRLLGPQARQNKMGISRSSRHKRSATGAQRPHYRKKRKFELGRQAASTKLGPKRVHTVRVRGGNLKYRALRLESGNFAWGSEQTTRKTRIIGVVYNASNNELVRTNTLVKSAIIQVDATPFRQWYEAHYAQPVTKKGAKTAPAEGAAATEETKKSKHVLRTLEQRKKVAKIDPLLETQFAAGRLYAAISSRPGQSGRADGYILEGRELEFYLRKLRTGKQKHAQ